jgi:hypothetical protein
MVAPIALVEGLSLLSLGSASLLLNLEAGEQGVGTPMAIL